MADATCPHCGRQFSLLPDQATTSAYNRSITEPVLRQSMANDQAIGQIQQQRAMDEAQRIADAVRRPRYNSYPPVR